MGRFVVAAPVDKYAGPGWGLHFIEGKAETDNAALAAKLQAKGYTVTDKEAEKADHPAPEQEEKPAGEGEASNDAPATKQEPEEPKKAADKKAAAKE